MRALLVTPYPPLKDGIGDYTHSLGQSLAARGHEVAAITPRSVPGSPPEVIGNLSQLGEARAAVRAFAPDVVHLQFAVAAFGAAIPALLRFIRTLEVPLVVTFHEITRDTAALRRPGHALYRSVANRTAAMVAHTNRAADALRDEVGAVDRPLHVIPLPATDPPVASTTVAELRRRHGLDDARVLLAFGFIHVDKGLDDLTRAFALLRQRPGHDDVRLAVAGDVRRRSGPFRIFEARDRLHLRAIRRDARRLGVSGATTESGYVPSGDIRAWLDLAEVLVLPYRSIEQSGVASMAASVGTPMLVSEAGSLAQHFGDERWTLPMRDPIGMAAVIEQFLASGGRAAAVQRSIEDASMESVITATEAVYAQAVDTRREGTHAA